jgi:hypothetical protein
VRDWNVRTLLDREYSSRPERRTAFIAKELARYHIDITAMSERRFADEGMLRKPEQRTLSFGKVNQLMKIKYMEWSLLSEQAS